MNVDVDGARYLRGLLSSKPEWAAAGETLISRISRNDDVDIPTLFFDAAIGWAEMIKAIRTVYGVSIVAAQDMALGHEGWLRWVKQRCTTDRSCIRQAHRAAKTGALPHWLVLEGGKVTFVR